MLHELALAGRVTMLELALAEVTKHAKEVCEWARIGQLCHGDTYSLRMATERASLLLDQEGACDAS